MVKRSRQRGLSLLGFLFVTAVVIIAVLFAFRVIPSYIEYYTVKKAVAGALHDGNDMSTQAIRKSFGRRIAADYVDSVTENDLQVSKSGNDIVGSVSWQTKLPLFYNISLLLDFDVNEAR